MARVLSVGLLNPVSVFVMLLSNLKLNNRYLNVSHTDYFSLSSLCFAVSAVAFVLANLNHVVSSLFLILKQRSHQPFRYLFYSSFTLRPLSGIPHDLSLFAATLLPLLSPPLLIQ